MANPEREIKDMQTCIIKLEDARDELDGAIASNHLDAINCVIDEWHHTKECIQEMGEKLGIF